MNLVVIGDTHIAKKWEQSNHSDIKAHNPNNTLRKMLANVSPDDFLIINGDLVDYAFSNYLSKLDSNWTVFFTILKKFKGKYLLNIGNHDYRKAPPEVSLFGLQHVEVNTQKRHKNRLVFKIFKLFRRFNSITARNTNKFHKKYLDCRSVTFEDSQVLLLNTGPDAFTRLSQLLNPLKWLFLLSKDPPSIGLSQSELQILDLALANKKRPELILVLHCPPFFSTKASSPVKLSKGTYFGSLLWHGLNQEIFLRNNWKFIEKLLESSKNILVVTSHSHRPKQYIIDKNLRTLRDSSLGEINKLRKNSQYIKFISTLPLGSIREHNQVGCLKITNSELKYEILEKY